MQTKTVVIQCPCVEGGYTSNEPYDCDCCPPWRGGIRCRPKCKVCKGESEVELEIDAVAADADKDDDLYTEATITALWHIERKVGLRAPETDEDKRRSGKVGAALGFRDPVRSGDSWYEQGRMEQLAAECAATTAALVAAAKGEGR